MPKNNKFNQFQVPIDLAAEMMGNPFMTQVLNQVMGPDKPTREARLGEEAQKPILDELLIRNMMENI